MRYLLAIKMFLITRTSFATSLSFNSESGRTFRIICQATPNLKYKAIFALMYSSGLRVSEVIHLNYEDISRTNMQIYIRNSKTHSSRYAILSKRALDILTEYWFKCGKPKGILFPNQWTGEYLTSSATGLEMRKSVKKSRFTQRCTFPLSKA